MFITGGEVDGRQSNRVTRFELSDNTFHDVADLNESISGHSSTIAGKKLYVIGKVIEFLDLHKGGASWWLVESPNYSNRSRPCVVAMSPK